MAETDDRTAGRAGEELAPLDAYAGFDGFFDDSYPALARALALALGDAELGRDAAAEGFVRALARWERVAAYDNPSGWVYRVGLNWGRSRWRKRRREALGARVEDRGDRPGASDLDLDLAAAIHQLSVDHRAVVVGRYYLDWSEAQLAAALDIAPGTVKSRLSRALHALAEKMEDNDG